MSALLSAKAPCTTVAVGVGSCALEIWPACLTERKHPAQAALGSQLPSAAAGTSAVVLAALRDAYPAEVMNLASNLDMNVRPAIPAVQGARNAKRQHVHLCLCQDVLDFSLAHTVC